MAGRCIPDSMGQSGCIRLSPIQPDQEGHQSANVILIPQDDRDCSMLTAFKIVGRSSLSHFELLTVNSDIQAAINARSFNLCHQKITLNLSHLIHF